MAHLPGGHEKSVRRRVFGLGPERQAVNGAGNGGALTYP